MNRVLVGMIYIPSSMKELDLKMLSSEVVKDERFIMEHPADDYYVTFSSTDKNNEVSVYFNGMIYYIEKMKKEDFNSRRMLSVAKEGFDFIKNGLSLHNDYLQRIGLIVMGNNMEIFYAEKKQVIEDFGMNIFKKPIFSELEKTDFHIQMSIGSDESSFLSIVGDN